MGNDKIDITTSAAMLENLPRTADTKARRTAAARAVLKAVSAYCEAEGLDLVGDHACPTCGFLDEAWYCQHCNRPIPKSQIHIAAMGSPRGHQHQDKIAFVGFCPHCPPGCTELPEPEPDVEA